MRTNTPAFQGRNMGCVQVATWGILSLVQRLIYHTKKQSLNSFAHQWQMLLVQNPV